MAKISGSKFKQAREKADVSRNELSRVAMMSYTRIFQIETEEVSHVNDLAVSAMAKKMKVKPEDLAA